jgi:hypothetical protein
LYKVDFFASGVEFNAVARAILWRMEKTLVVD